jgi:hypothetical protein
MKLEKTITIFATEEAKKKWEGKEFHKKNKKSNCPQCEIDEIKKNILNDEINLREEDLYNKTI